MIVQDDDVYGDGVNIAVRLEGFNMEKFLSHADTRKVSERWAQEPDDSINWATIPYVGKRDAQLAGADPEKDKGAWHYMLDKYWPAGQSLDRVLSLCCGHGHAERVISELRDFRVCDAFDVSEPALENARRLAQAAAISNVNYERRDLNNLKLSHQYDYVIGSGIHHIFNLKGLFAEISRCLSPGGTFLMDEYIGPAQCQPTARQVEAINACIHLLPERYRVRVTAQRELGATSPDEALQILKEMPPEPVPAPATPTETAQVGFRELFRLSRRSFVALREGRLRERLRSYLLSRLQSSEPPREALENHGPALVRYFWTEFVPMTKEQWDEHDPSEAVRSDEIISLLRGNFDEVDVRYTSGPILQFTLYDLAANFYNDTQEVKDILDMLFKIEEVLLKYDDIPQNYAVIAARNTR